jgi:hypothetical protein
MAINAQITSPTPLGVRLRAPVGWRANPNLD